MNAAPCRQFPLCVVFLLPRFTVARREIAIIIDIYRHMALHTESDVESDASVNPTVAGLLAFF